MSHDNQSHAHVGIGFRSQIEPRPEEWCQVGGGSGREREGDIRDVKRLKSRSFL